MSTDSGDAVHTNERGGIFAISFDSALTSVAVPVEVSLCVR